MKFLWWIGTIPAGLAVIVLAVANRHSVAISLDPLPYRFDLPVYVVAFVTLAIGFAAGAACTWLSGRKSRRLASTRRRKVARLERDLARLRDGEDPREDRTRRLTSASAP